MAHDRVEAVERALSLLDAFSEAEPVLSLTDLSEKTGFYKSTVLRLSRSLERFQYLTRDEAGLYRLGPALWRLGALSRLNYDLERIIRPALVRLRDGLGETASFYVRDGDVRICLYRVNSLRPIRHHLDEGTQLPLAVGAAGRVLSGTPDGWAASMGERDPEVAAVAVPLMDGGGGVIGALAVSGLINHFDDHFQQRCRAALQEEARELEHMVMGTH